MDARTCRECGAEKPYDPTAKKDLRASGFKGRVCWECYLEAKAKAQRKIRSTPEGRKKANAVSVKSCRKIRSTPEGRKKANASAVESNMKRLKADAWFCLRHHLGSETRRILKLLANGRGTDEACLKLFGQNRDTCLAYFEKQLTARGWAWDDYLNGGIEADHVLPFGVAQNSNELRTLALLENVQLLTRAENAIKATADRQLIKQYEDEV